MKRIVCGAFAAVAVSLLIVAVLAIGHGRLGAGWELSHVPTGSDASATASDFSRELLANAPDYALHGDGRFRFLAPDKRTRVTGIERDYQELVTLIHRSITHRLQPIEAAQLQLLESEKQKDLTAVLTPLERAEYDLRFSATAERLIRQLIAIDATVDEYRRVFPLERAFDLARSDKDSEVSAERSAAAEALIGSVAETLGEERARWFVWSHDSDFLVLNALARQHGCPIGAAAAIVTARDAVLARAVGIVTAPGLSETVKRTRLSALARDAVSELNATLGPDVAHALNVASLRWVSALQRGIVSTYHPITQRVTLRSAGVGAVRTEPVDAYTPQIVQIGAVHIPGPFAVGDPPGADEN